MEKTGEQQIYEDIFAPAAMEFAAWILEQSVKDGTERLYFLARDGYQIWLAAKTTAEKRGFPWSADTLRAPGSHGGSLSTGFWRQSHRHDMHRRHRRYPEKDTEARRT